MIKKVIVFIAGWTIGVIVMNHFIFKLFLEFIKSEDAVAILCTLIIMVFTLVYGVIVGQKNV